MCAKNHYITESSPLCIGILRLSFRRCDLGAVVILEMDPSLLDLDSRAAITTDRPTDRPRVSDRVQVQTTECTAHVDEGGAWQAPPQRLSSLRRSGYAHSACILATNP